ncbi:hypothetical protein [Ruficoccus sp. ZRK36]|uniref:hypothetical protein n=1 Tax=Ruficoccus sp. ZRK36 TaxID=2866311 RepID=UPI001C73298F|nr:hypothetical protein [Ruficoccus sp. ZRK36]QYY37207.1 hypothetical protein K0V07_06910 [Ruficoccus sp. ZRK36]
MLRISGCCLLLLALFSALNVHWAVLQGVAWASMLSEEQQRGAKLREAIERTFGGEYPCDICGLVDANLLKEPKPLKAARQAEYLSVKLLLPRAERLSLTPVGQRISLPPMIHEQAAVLPSLPETPPPRVA